MSADENGDVVAGPESTPTAAEIMENLQQLNDIEGDLATTAVAVAEAAPEQKEGEVEAPAPTDSVEGAAASTTPEAEPSSTATAQNDQAALLQAAQGVENALEQSIPDAPVHDTNVQPDASTSTPVSGPVNPEASASSATTPAPAPAQTHSQVDDLIDIVKKDEEPILPIDIASLARLPDSTDADATANADAIAIDQTSGSVDVAPAETHVPDQTLAGQTPLQPTDEGYKPAPVPTPTPEVNGAAGQAVKVEQIQEVAVPQEKLVLPEGLTEKSASVAENRGIAQEWSNDPTNINATLALFNWSIQRSEIQDARAWYAVIAKENPTATQPLLALIDLESTLSNFPQVEALFATTLKAAAATGESAAVVAPDVAIWKAYLHYVRRQNPLVEGPQLEKTRQTITQGYEFALGQCGMDLLAGEIWGEYLAFVQGSNPKNHWEVQAQQDALRKIYQRCVCIPLINLEVIWKQYDAFESSINKATAKQYLAGRSPAYMTARSALRELRSLHDAIRHFSGPVPPKPTFSDNDRQLVGAWKAYLKWEQGNPLVLEPEEVLDERVGYAMKRCLAEMRHFPEMWHLVAGYYLGKDKEERGMAVLKAGVDACPKSVLLTFAAAELAETLKNPTLAHSLFTNLLEHLSTEAASIQSLLERDLVAQMGPEIPKPDSSATRTESNTNGGGNMDVDEDAFAPQSEYTRLVAEREQRGERVKEVRGKEVQEVKDAMGVVWVMYMRFARRAEGIKSARQVFGRARKSVWVSWHPFEASALMEYHSNKDQGVAVRIFELGFKSFPDSPDFIVRYVQFLLSVNDDNNARALFERSTIKMPADKIRPLWDLWAKYEYMYGDLTAVHKLEKRWAEAFPNDSPLRRFAQRYTYDGLDQIALRDLGLGRYNRNQAEAHARGYSGPTAPMPPPADSAPPTSSLQSQATFQPPTPLNAPGNSAPPAIPPHMAASGAPIPPNMAGPGPGPVGGNKRPLGGAPGSQSPSRSHGLARPRGSMERSSSPSRMGMGMGMGYPGAPPPGGGPMPGERENFVPNKRYRANSPRRNDRDRRGGNQGQGQGQGRDRTPLGGAPGPGPVARNLSGAGPGPGAGYGYVPREGYDRSGVGRALAWFVGELPSARSFDGPVFRSDDIVGLFNNIAPDGTRAGPGGGGGGQAPVYAAPMSQQMPPAPMRGGPGYGGPPGGGQGYAPPGGRRY